MTSRQVSTGRQSARTGAATSPKNKQAAADNKAAKIDRQNEYGEREPGSLSGNLTRDFELRFTPAGRPVASSAVAVNDKVYNEDTKEWEETEPEFYNITAWNQQAENCVEFLKKGNRIVAVGYFQDRTYTNREDERVTVTEFTAKDIGPSMLWNGAKIIKADRS